jgi:WD40 repeat protein
MASTISISAIGLEIVDRARRHKGWNKTEAAWQVTADIAKATLDRFWMQKPIKHKNFVAICEAVGVDWEQVIDSPAIEPINIKRASNLSQVNQPVILELEEFAQQIFDWFGALDFKFEGLPRREGNYVEWIILIPVRRSRFDRVLIRAVIHEVSLGDLDSLRKAVRQPIDEGWLVTNLWVSPAAKQACSKSDYEGLDCLTFDQLIDQDANFEPYLDWLTREIKKKEIDRYYVDLGCIKKEFDVKTQDLRGASTYSVADGGIDFYIDRWLENPVTEHVSILGEFGTGKTWFAFHYAGKCLQAYRLAKEKGLPRPRLPLVIPLRDYAKALNVENVLAGFFYTQHNIRLNSDVFDRLNQMGKLLLIFDGFDEMADKVDRQKMTYNFWELAKVVTPNAKVILTCRTEHFPTDRDERENLSGERRLSTASQTTVAPKFETLELMKFNKDQIRDILSRRTNSATVKLVIANDQLLDLLRRAVMAEFVLEALPEIEAGKPIDLARVYLYAVRHKMERDITTGRTFTSLADKLYFLCELAWEMLSEDKMSLNYRDFPDKLRLLFGKEVAEQKHLDHWHYDMMGQTMLIRDDDGDYSPAHRSLLEFFSAYKLAAELGLLASDFLEVAQEQSGIDENLPPQLYDWSSYWHRTVDKEGHRVQIGSLLGFKPESSKALQDTFAKKPLTKAILDLLWPMLDWDVIRNQRDVRNQHLLEIIQFTKKKTMAEAGYMGGSAATILMKLNPYALKYRDLSDTNLAYADLVNVGLRGTNLHGANLENSSITSVFGLTNAIVMSTDDRHFITAHDDKTIRIWDRDSGRELQKLSGHEQVVRSIVLSKDGKTLYSGSDDRTIKEWKLSDGLCSYTFIGHEGLINAIVLSKDGEFLYSGSDDGVIKQWQISDYTCQGKFEGHRSSVNAIVLSEDGKFLYSGSNDCTIKKWQISDRTCQHTLDAHRKSVNAIVLSNDAKFLYSGSNDCTIKEWLLGDGICQRTLVGHQSSVNAIVLSRDGQLLYSGSDDRTINEWKLSDGICQRMFEGHEDWVNAIALSSGGEFLYSSSQDGTIKEWKIADKICQRTFYGCKSPVNTIVLSDDGEFLYSGSQDGTIEEWRLEDGACYRKFESHQGSVSVIVLSRNEKLLYAGNHDGEIKEWMLTDGKPQRSLECHQDWVNAIALSSNGEFIYSGSHDGTIKEWKIADGKCQRTFDIDQYCINANISTTYENNSIDGHQDWVKAIVLSADGKFLYAGGDRTINEWDLSDGTCQRTFKSGEDRVFTIALSADGKFLYAGGDRTINEWDLLDSSQRRFESHQSCVTAIALSTDGKLLYSGSHDCTIKEWDLVDGICINSIDYRLCAGANTTNVKGLTPAQTDALFALGAISND